MDKTIKYCPCCGGKLEEKTHLREDDANGETIVCSKEKLEVLIEVKGFGIWNPKP